MKRLAIISTHPIQYNAPLFKELADRNNIQIKVFYTWSQASEKVFDPGFGNERIWDIPLLDGYPYEFVQNVSKYPGSHHFKGINNPGLIDLIWQWNPDTLMVFGWSFISHLKLLRHFKGKKKILFRGDSNLLDETKGASLKKIIRTLFLRWVYRHIDIALYTGSANKTYFLRHGLKNNQLIFAPHAIDNNRFMKSTMTNSALNLAIPSNSIVFMFAGKFEEKKNPLLLLEGFIELSDHNTHLIFVGNGELELRLKRIVQNLTSSLTSRIHFLPFQNQQIMPFVYRLCDVFVLPSSGPGETWGLSVNEAMVSGRAILVSDKCGCGADLVKEGMNGFVFKSASKANLVKKMKLFASDKSIATDMGKVSLEIINSWNFENICKAIESAVI